MIWVWSSLLLVNVLKTFLICIFSICKYIKLIKLILYLQQDQISLQLKLDLDYIYDLIIVMTVIDLLLMMEKGIRGRTFPDIHWYMKANNKYVKGYDKNKESAHVKSWDNKNKIIYTEGQCYRSYL